MKIQLDEHYQSMNAKLAPGVHDVNAGLAAYLVENGYAVPVPDEQPAADEPALDVPIADDAPPPVDETPIVPVSDEQPVKRRK